MDIFSRRKREKTDNSPGGRGRRWIIFQEGRGRRRIIPPEEEGEDG